MISERNILPWLIINLLKTKRYKKSVRTSAVNTFHHGYKNQSVNDV